MIGNVAIYGLYLLLAGAALMDLWKLRIPNLFPVAVIGLFVVWLAVSPVRTGLWQNGLVFVLTLVGGAFLFSRQWLGGGDVKLLAAIALWFDFAGAAGLFLYIGLGGAVLSLFFILVRRMIPERVGAGSIAPALKRRGPIPYGIAIAGGAALAISGGGINPHPRPRYTFPTGLSDRIAEVSPSTPRSAVRFLASESV